MVMIDVVYWLPTGGPITEPVGLVQRSAATWHCSAFIGWTVAVVLPWWLHYYYYYVDTSVIALSN